MSSGLDFWARLERSIGPPPVGSGVSVSTQTDEEKRNKADRFRRNVRILDITASALWAYALVKFFVIDVDRVLLEAISPSLVDLLNYRLFLYLAVLSAAVVLLRRKAWLVGAYVFLFPLIVGLWKIPAFFWRRKSWPLLLGATQAVFSLFSDFRYKLITKSLALLAAVLILFTDVTPLILAATGYVVVLLIWSLGRVMVRAFTSPSFVSVQRETILGLLSSPRIRKALALNDAFKRADVERYEPSDAQQIMTVMGMGIALNKALYLWAYQLERYRRDYKPSLVFGGLSFVWLFVATLIAVSLINFGLMKIDPSQYGPGGHSFIAVLIYSLSTMALSEGGGIVANGDLAFLVQLLSGLAGVLVLAFLGVNVVLTLRRERDDQATKELVAELRTRAREQAAEFRSEFSVSVDDAKRKLDEIGFVFGSLLGQLSAAIPDDLLEEPD